MKSKVVQLFAVLIFGSSAVFAQDIPQSQVPSVILNNFKKEFPKANDIEWELKGETYNVEFEISWNSDYEAWYSADGKMIRYTQDINNSDFPKSVLNSIKTKYSDYRIDDAKKIVINGVETYRVELEKGQEEMDVLFSKDGKVIPF
ncbi:PepSY-like domain-containing protein [Brumimicrobium mesophilum]|uniref:PepSY-like domain-containing protein n=1 Tax=Brumimicrobium mesophilum TaxID=392717 RepID=UPI000D141015|nr:PepSY-like domain-containing protein [Brumimicrobium mesophilum]